MNNVRELRPAVKSPDGQIPPHDPMAEAATVTACMLSPDCAAKALSIAAPADFYWPMHREIAQCIADLLEAGSEPNPTNVSMRLRETGRMSIVGGDKELIAMMERVPAVGTIIERYAGKVRDLAQVRSLAFLLHRLVAECYQPIEDVGAFLGGVDTQIGDATRRSQAGAVTTALEAAKKVAKQIESPPIPGIPTGLTSLDRATSGFERGCFYVLAARTSMGKTAMALQMAIASADAGHVVVYASMEMPHVQLMRRLVCSRAGIPVRAVKQRQMTHTQWSAYAQASSYIGGLPIRIADATGQTLLDLKSTVRAQKAGLLIVDHIGLLKAVASSAGAKRSREQEVAEFSRGLKALAMEYDIPVMALCQVGRDAGKGARMPTLTDLRESGAIEQDADGVWLIHRPGYYDSKASEEVKREAVLSVAKTRDGETPLIPLVWEGSRQAFYDLERSDGEHDA